MASVQDNQNDSKTAEDDPFKKTKRFEEFSSENNKLEITNLPTHSKYHIVKQLLEKRFKINAHKIRVGKKSAFIAFATQEARDEALAKINNQEWKGRTLEAKIAEARPDVLIKKLRTEPQNTDEKCESEEPTADDIIAQACPLWNKSYEDQLKIKESNIKSVLNFHHHLTKLCPGLARDCPKLHQWLKENKEHYCHFEGVIPSPILLGYRNKCEFNVGSDGTVGFRMGRYKDGSERVFSPPENCPIINKNMFKILEAFQSMLRSSSDTKLKGFNHVTHDGNFRQITIRSNEKNECLVIVDLHPQDMSEAELTEHLRPMIDLLKSIDEVVSIYLNISEKNHISGSDSSLKLAYGQSFLYEYLAIDPELPLKFRIGPTSFFQINTKAAEVLYKSIIEVANLSSKSLVLDVGCGTGTIGLSLAKLVNYVIGIEIVEAAIEDAKMNAQDNNISNVSFFAGKAEDLIDESIMILKDKLSSQANEGEIVAILDPPRIGFNNSFVKSLRASKIRKIVYVACDPKANTNLTSLCRPTSKAYQGEPFVPIKAKAFDLFPHTKFCELVLVYERLVD